MVSVCVPAFPLVGDTVTHDVEELTLAVHAALVVKVTVAVLPFCSTTGTEPLISTLLLSGLGAGSGISSSSGLQLQKQAIIIQSKTRKVSFILLSIICFTIRIPKVRNYF